MTKSHIFYAPEGKLSSEGIELCVHTLKNGGVLIVPTDTVYGLICNAFDPAAIKKIYALKGRDYSKPLPVFLDSFDQLSLVAIEVTKEAKRLADKYWPGPLTMVFRTAPMALHASHGKRTLAVRVPDHGVVKQILEEIKIPLAATSANISGEPSISIGKTVIQKFENKVDIIVNAGACPVGSASTVIDATHYPFTILRHGAVPKDDLYAQVHT